jgi:redox-sensitive bicupin YhaK (pirin superfamily)
VASPIAIWQDAAAYVARLEGATLTHDIAASRFAFLFVGTGTATVNGETLGAGDAARIAGPIELSVSGSDSEIVLWDVPSL